MPEPLFIGIDGGGTQCRARLCDASGATLGEGRGGPANVRLDPARVMGSILQASREAVRAAGIAEAELRHAYAGLGLAGARLKSACAALLAEPSPFAAIAIETDTHVAWLGALGGEDGAVFIIGTGSSSLAVVGGVSTEIGGYGAEISDEASGNWFGRELLRRALWAHDGRTESTPLAEVALARFDNSRERFIAFATSARPADYAALAPLVFEHAERGDPLALALVREAAADAARIIDRLVSAGAPAVCLIGGVAGPLSDWLPEEARARLAKPRGDALQGAVMLARRAMADARETATVDA